MNQNPAGTRFEVSRSTDNFAAHFSTPIAFSDNFTANTTDFTGLSSGTTYYVRIRAINGDSLFTTPFSVVNSTRTQGAGAPDGFSGTALGVSSVSWNWNTVSGAGSYNLYMASSPATLVQSGIAGPPYEETGLSTNTAYGRVVTAMIGPIETGLSNSATTYTLAAIPSGSALAGVFTTSVAFQWNANDNPTGTQYQSFIDTQPSFATAVSSLTLNTSAVHTPLTSNTTYYLRVRARNGDGFNTDYDASTTTVTPAAIPNNGSITSVTNVSLSIAWGADTNGSGTEYQAELSTISAVGTATASVVTTSLSNTFNDLTTDTTYYARVRALGFSGADSAFLIIGASVTALGVPPNVAFSMVGTSSLTVTWTPLGGSNIEYVVQLASADPFAVPQSSTTALSSAAFAGLSVNALYSARVATLNLITGTTSNFSTPISTYTLANPPITLTTTSVSGTAVSLSWGPNGNPGITSYGVERSTNGSTYIALATQMGSAYTDLTVNGGTTYYYQVRALNVNNVPTTYSNVVTVLTPGVLTAPKAPNGLWGARTSTQGTYRWTQVTQRTDGTPLTNLAGYQIFGSNTLLAPRSSWAQVAAVTEEVWSTTFSAASANYYCVRTVDTNGRVSDYSHIMDDTSQLNHFYMAQDNVTRARIPEWANNVLLADNNPFGADLSVVVEDVASEETNRVVESYDIKLVREDTGLTVPYMAFGPGSVHVTIRYVVQGGQVIQGAPARVPVLNASEADKGLSLFWHNGVEWVKVSGQTSLADTTVSQTSDHIGRYQIRVAARSSSIAVTRVYPRIITPNGDGWNDKVIFQFDNPQLLPLSGKIYDISGSFVADCVAGPNTDSSLSWDGKDSGGRSVPGGIYLYQVDLQGSAITGSIVVAR